ncbi:MAG: hypothetical protein ACNI25_03855 [Halarcobacter sp.]
MSDRILQSKINRIVEQSGFSKKEKILCSVMKIVQMRHKDVDKNQALRVTKFVLEHS